MQARLVLIAAGTAAAAALFLVEAHPARLAAALGSLPPGAVAAAVAATSAGVVLGAYRWRALLASAGVPAGVGRLLSALAVGAAVNNLVPARGGDAVRLERARRHTGARRREILGTLVAERALDGLVLALLVLAGALLRGEGGVFLWVGGGLLGAIVVAAAVGRVRLLRRPALLATALVTSAGIWLADVVMYGALAHGFHLAIPFASLLLLVGAGNLALAVPGTAAGLGSFELVTLAGAHGIGVGGPQLAAYVLAVHAVIVLPTTVAGLVCGAAGAARSRRPARA